MYDLTALGKNSKLASKKLSNTTEQQRNLALNLCAKKLRENKEFLKQENSFDVALAKEKGMSDAFIDRLMLTDKVIDGMAEGLEQVAQLTAPLNQVVYSHENEFQGIKIVKKTVPFGVIGIIYESRPNVTADAFALCFKTANAVILKGGSDSLRSNMAIVKVIKQGLNESGITADTIALIEDTSRQTTTEFMKMNKYVDLLIPRGSASLIKSALENATMPIIETGTGNCHVYVDESANVQMSANVIFNAKTQRYI